MASGESELERAVVGTIVVSDTATTLLYKLDGAVRGEAGILALLKPNRQAEKLRDRLMDIENLLQKQHGFWNVDEVKNKENEISSRIEIRSRGSKDELRVAMSAWRAAARETGAVEFEMGPMGRLSGVLEQLAAEGASVVDKDVVLGAWADVSEELDGMGEESRRIAVMKLAQSTILTVGNILVGWAEEYYRKKKEENGFSFKDVKRLVSILDSALAESRRHVFATLFGVKAVPREKAAENPAEDSSEEEEEDEDDEEEEETDEEDDDTDASSSEEEEDEEEAREENFVFNGGWKSEQDRDSASVYRRKVMRAKLSAGHEYSAKQLEPLGGLLAFGNDRSRVDALRKICEVCDGSIHNKMSAIRGGVVAAIAFVLNEIREDHDEDSIVRPVLDTLRCLIMDCPPVQLAAKQEDVLESLSYCLECVANEYRAEVMETITACVNNCRGAQNAARRAGILEELLETVEGDDRGMWDEYAVLDIVAPACRAVGAAVAFNEASQRKVLKRKDALSCLVELFFDGEDVEQQQCACEAIISLASDNGQAWEVFHHLDFIPRALAVLRGHRNSRQFDSFFPPKDSHPVKQHIAKGTALTALRLMAEHDSKFLTEMAEMDIFSVFLSCLDLPFRETTEDVFGLTEKIIIIDPRTTELAVNVGMVGKIHKLVFMADEPHLQSLATRTMAIFTAVAFEADDNRHTHTDELAIPYFKKLFQPQILPPTSKDLIHQAVQLLAENSWKSTVAAALLLALSLNNNDNKLFLKTTLKNTPLAREVLQSIQPSKRFDPSILCLLTF